MSGQDNIEGYIDRFENGVLSGWAWRPEDPRQALILEAVLDNEALAVVAAAKHRADLGAHGKRAGECAFEFELGDLVKAGDVVEVRVRDTGEPVPGSPFTIPPPSLEQAEPAVVQPSTAPSLPFVLGGASGVSGSLDGVFHGLLSGWAHRSAEPRRRVVLELHEGGRRLGAFAADRWRKDLEELRQGDGGVGFSFPMPAEVCDGVERQFDLRDAESGLSLLPAPFSLTISHPPPPAANAPPARAPKVKAGKPKLSIIIVFYNMRREAERALRALSREYQRRVADLAYEVLCIDNGSAEPLDAAWVGSFGPEFRLVRPSRILPSPCFAINEAARMAKGERLAIMIDGAHILTPGVFAEAMAAMDESKDAVVGLRQWFVGGDQRWLAVAGHTREDEDLLFDKIAWPNDGYRLFQVGSPMFESPDHWFNGAAETNCVFITADLYRRLGGFDEAFSEPGAGYANLDFFHRAAETADRLTFLVGEASFHQFHGGTTTNVGDARKDELVRAFVNRYRNLRGADFDNVPFDSIHLRGRIQTVQALTGRQHIRFPGGLGLTRDIRPDDVSYLFDSNAQHYLRAAYVECGLHRKTQWAGRPVDLAPGDLLSIQEIMRRIAPDCIVLADETPGLVGFISDARRTLGLEETLIAHVSASAEPGPGVTPILGRPDAPETLAEVRRQVGAAEQVLVLFEPHADDELPIASLSAYAAFVSFGSFLVFLRSGISQPWIGYSRNWRHAAIHRLAGHGAFEVDPSFEEHLVTLCPHGFLRRTGGLALARDYDPALDDLEQF